MDIIERDIYTLICRNDGIKAREIAAHLHKDRAVIHHYLYGSPYRRELCYKEWFEMLKQGCRQIGRNLNDTRGLFHSFWDEYDTMRQLFADLDAVDVSRWEIAFELRLKRAK